MQRLLDRGAAVLRIDDMPVRIMLQHQRRPRGGGIHVVQQCEVDAVRRCEGSEVVAAEIVALLKSEGDTFASYLEGLHEPFLAEQVAMPPGVQPTHKSRFEMLLSPKEHEMHHRAQLMVIQRMLGMTPHLTRAMQQRMAQAAQA